MLPPPPQPEGSGRRPDKTNRRIGAWPFEAQIAFAHLRLFFIAMHVTVTGVTDRIPALTKSSFQRSGLRTLARSGSKEAKRC